ncbi:MAG: demethylmenaquinone methyltransferase [bacterium]|nr:MAG: demethylmenaquinone methyltransferase [bacterium]
MLSKNAKEIERLFSAIAPTYDLLNSLLSFGVDRRWRKKAVKTLAPNSGLYLDVAAGTGGMAAEIFNSGKDVRVIAADLSHEMLKIGIRKSAGMKISYHRVDALALSFRGGSFNGVTCAFGIRNFSNLKAGLKEILRVLKPGGSVVILEFSKPANAVVRGIYFLYFTRVLPFIGRMVSGHDSAYSYLPESVRTFPDGRVLKRIFMDAGFDDVTTAPLTFGICSLIRARKPAA